MTFPRRAEVQPAERESTAGRRELDALRASGATLTEFVVAGGLRGFTPEQMLEGAA